MRKLVVHVVGARPNYMKVAPVYAALEQRGNVEQRLVHTGQHYDREINDVFFEELPLPEPHHQLASAPARHGEQTARRWSELERCSSWSCGPTSWSCPATSTRRSPPRSPRRSSASRSATSRRACAASTRTMPEEHNRTAHRPPLGAAAHALARTRNENLAGRGHRPAEAIALRRQHDDRHAARERRARARARRAWRDLGLETGGYVLVTLHRPALVDDAAAAARGRCAASSEIAQRAAGRLPGAPAHARSGSSSSGSRDRRVAARADRGRLPRVPLAPGRRGRGRDRLGRRPGGDDGARRPVLHAARQHRAAGDRRRTARTRCSGSSRSG